MQIKKTAVLGSIITGGLLFPVVQPLAQEGIRATLELGQRIETVEESGFTTPQDEGTRTLTTIDFGLTSETSNQRLDLSLNTAIAVELGSNDSTTDTVDDPSARLSYDVENRNSQLSFYTAYRRGDVGASNFFDELLGENVIVDGGKRTTFSVGSDLSFGRESPVTTTLGYAYLRSTFSDLPDSSTQSDSTTNRVEARVTFRLSPVASVFVFGRWRENDQDLATAVDQTTQSFGIGSEYDISPVTRITAQVSYDREDSESSISSNSNSGSGFALGITRTAPRGIYSADLSQEQTINGAQYQLLFGRSIELQRGDLRFSLGGVKRDGLSADPLANLSLSYELTPLSNINITLDQRASVDDNDVSTINSRLNVNYNYTLNALSSLSAGLQIAEVRASDIDGSDESDITASLTYRRELGADWDLISGLRYESSRSENAEDRDTSTLFVGLAKTFDFRP